MHARDSSGRQVSLLNDEPTSQSSIPHFQTPSYSGYSSRMDRSHSNTSVPSNASSPGTPGLIRADSYDSQNTNDAHSPLTPTYMGDFGRQGSYTSVGPYKEPAPQYDHHEGMVYDYPPHSKYDTQMRPSFPDSRSCSYADPQVYEDEPYQNGKGGKRYPCRFRESHGCDRTFTTSGHASRHSKIHTAEKAVQCTFQGCQKKFTRADNMKQHLETHYKERSRSSGTQRSAASKPSLTMPSGVKKPTSNGRTSHGPQPGNAPELLPLDPQMFAPPYAAGTAPVSPATTYGALHIGGFQDALMSQPIATQAALPSTGLDALVFAADYQQNHG